MLWLLRQPAMGILHAMPAAIAVCASFVKMGAPVVNAKRKRMTAIKVMRQHLQLQHAKRLLRKEQDVNGLQAVTGIAGSMVKIKSV